MPVNSTLRAMRGLSSVLVLATLGACEKVVELDVADGPVRLVVEGRLESPLEPASVTLLGRQSLRLTTTSPYFSNSPQPPARGAVVTVRDDLGRVVAFPESSTPGTYRTDSLVARAGRTYTLRIEWQGDRYEAVESLSSVAPIDSLYFMPRPKKDPAIDGLRATIDLRDPPVTRNYYLWDQYVDGERLVSPDTVIRYRVVTNDEFYEGRRVRAYQPFDGRAVRRRQEVLVRQYSISEAVWRYYDALNRQVDGDGSPFGVPPSSVRGNVANLTSPSKPALGYFVASEVSERRARVP
ncbi:DUF4249 domain-containing protein [Gemmatimonas groenlandica]|uniref:DUF4249 domain-containing protein n=1 Tax=Gemmatimonas groenlandica TaxID=2732249 RepID=A0A6M4IU05_9BACT|nr:DUF4249 domain-containing protein [Gemmatimonas groenlandica]QJR35691.1 DUF4249 domain-containing protein [Gemmatimonas groenlandica]